MDLRNTHIMVVDDIADNLQVIGSILHNEGFNTSFAHNGKQALEITPEIMPDLILLDVSMPGLTGFEVCTFLKMNERTKHIPIIFLTARTETESMVHGFTLGAADYITKPFNNQELLARVKAHLEIKISRDTINEQNEKLKVLNTTKDKFFSIIAHDLKNPFAVLISSCELLIMYLHKSNIEKSLEKAEMIFSTSKQSFNLLQNLLDWTQSQLNNIVFEPSKLHLNDIVFETIKFIETQANDKNIKIVNEVPDNIDIVADATLLQFTLRNLFSNAVKYTANQGIITITATATANSTVEITVKDTGVGMDQDIINKLFRIDTKIYSKGTNGETGTGLGLVLCKEFIEKHGGNISVISELGRGSEFKITLPKV